MRNNLFIPILLATLIGCGTQHKLDDSIDLSGEDWSLSLSDRSEYATIEISHSQWEIVSLPNNLYKAMDDSDGAIWLRKTFDYNLETFKGNPVVYLGKIYETDQVFINGILVGDNGGRSVNFGRNRIYPIPTGLLVSGENLIAIRLSSSLTRAAGILSDPISISPLDQAWEKEWHTATKEFIYVSFFFFISLFYLLNYFRLRQSKEYLSFSIFAIVYCLYEYSRNEFRFNLIDNFLLFKFVEYASLFFIPYLFIRFVEDFLKFPRFKYSKVYLLLSASFALIFAIIQNHSFWFGFVGYWDIHLPFAVSYTIFLTYKRMKENVIGAYIHMLGLIYIFYAILKQIFIERGFLNVESSVENSVLFYFFIMTLALRMQFLFVKRNIQNRYDQLREADSLREKVFSHMELMISSPLKTMSSIFAEIRDTKDSKAKKEKVKELENIQSSLQPLMDDIIELSRLEVMNEVPFKASVPFVDFIKEVIPEDAITYSIKVDPATMIENSLELINSIVIRLIDFPGIREFTHNDLIVTQDLKGNIHFRFLLFHSNPKIAIHLYNELSGKHFSHLQDANTVKWQIIRQIARLLHAKLDTKIIKRKYLRIDLELKAIPAISSELEMIQEGIEKDKSRKPKNHWKDELRMIQEKLSSLLKKRK
ncbi:7TM diverse intracellular signaling domain-containing protein [Leptospira sp. GIMC2001]|uniref:7TM diverse intracellular signaling domain-containing protein n=1 Tax=Leptospira sp. GIMC2001 TaxID=1513297 RepID=UPI002349FF74|nr:7TM diverse intracellular signaling domain-containing protein [Leptospira sp. GIMC2001]WCL48531.1 hypothetical protein O4O04_14650 [Leptospira sp. GIMC2001]